MTNIIMNDNIILTDATTEDKDVASGGAQYTNSAETIQEDVVNECYKRIKQVKSIIEKLASL